MTLWVMKARVSDALLVGTLNLLVSFIFLFLISLLSFLCLQVYHIFSLYS